MKRFLRVFSLWGKSLKALIVSPQVWIPLGIMGLVHLGLLYGLFLFPRYPVKIIFAPIIKRFWGETYLHYPFNFFILPYLAKITRQILAVFLDFYFIAVFAMLCKDFWSKRQLNVKAAFKEPILRFFPLLAYSVILVLILFVVQKLPPYVFKTIYNSPIIAEKHVEFFHLVNQTMFYSLKLVTTIIQAFFIFTIPLLVIGEYSLLGSVDRSLQLAIRNFFTTLFLVLIPTLILFGLEQLVKTPRPLVENYFPEIVLIILFGIETLYILFSYLVIFSVTGLYLDSLKTEESLSRA